MNVRSLLLVVLSILPFTALQADLILSAPPRESEVKAKAIFDPIAAYLSKVTGERVAYKWSDNWLTYQSDMQKDAFDFLFDGPHFVSWRIIRYQHTPLVKLPKPLHFLAVTKADDARLLTAKKAAGYKVCTPAPPNLAALSFMNEFDNPARQPLLVDMHGYPQAFEGLMAGKCRVALMNSGVLAKMDKENKKTRVIFKSVDVANQAWTVSSRIPVSMRTTLRNALLSDEGKEAMKGLSAEYGGSHFVAVKPDEYNGYAYLLRDVWGFDIKSADGADNQVQRIAKRP